jgi:UDP-N-acetyl-D-galactosamine dehydrogenase
VTAVLEDQRICIVGLGYVGLPLAVEFARRHRVIGFEVDQTKVEQLKSGFDRMREVTEDDLKSVHIDYTTDAAMIGEADYVIVCVPTPIDKNNNPDLSLVESASQVVGQNMKEGATVVFESTVYPGVTEDICLPILEHESGMTCPTEF